MNGAQNIDCDNTIYKYNLLKYHHAGWKLGKHQYTNSSFCPFDPSRRQPNVLLFTFGIHIFFNVLEDEKFITNKNTHRL